MYNIKKSNIHGNGVFSSKFLSKNTDIGVGIDYYFNIFPFVTVLPGSLINHSYNPNCSLQFTNNKYHIVTNKNINKNVELTVNYNDAPWFIENAKPWYIS